MSTELIQKAIQSIEEQGYAVLERLIPESRAAYFAERLLAAPHRENPVNGYHIVRTLLNQDAEFAELMTHPVPLQIIHHLIGGRTEGTKNAFAWPKEDRVRLSIVDGLIVEPKSESGWWHVDPPMAQAVREDQPLPDFPLVVNAFWMLTPFRQETGATRLMPGSHRWRKIPPESRDDLEGQQYLTAPAGSVAIIPNTMWHTSSTNQSQQHRLAVAHVFAPWWVGQISRAAVPVKRKIWEQLPPVAQALTRHQLHWNVD